MGTSPAASMAVFSPISSETMDLPLVTVRAPRSLQMSTMIRLASAASRAKCTVPPAAVTCFS